VNVSKVLTCIGEFRGWETRIRTSDLGDRKPLPAAAAPPPQHQRPPAPPARPRCHRRIGASPAQQSIAMRLDQLVAQSLLRQRRGNRSGWRRHHRAHPLDERAAAGRQRHRLQIVLSVQNAIGQRLLLRQHRSITCSMLCSVTRLMTSTVRIWFFRQARAMRCSSFAGFHGRSRLITELAIWRLSPTLPLSVERNSRQSGSRLKRAISARRRSCGTDPARPGARTMSSSCHLAARPWPRVGSVPPERGRVGLVRQLAPGLFFCRPRKSGGSSLIP
jgi:hypothetical protein